jgi:hypothetical protein
LTSISRSAKVFDVVRLTLEVLDLVETENVTYASTNLDFGIVGEERQLGSTVFTDEVLKLGG